MILYLILSIFISLTQSSLILQGLTLNKTISTPSNTQGLVVKVQMNNNYVVRLSTLYTIDVYEIGPAFTVPTALQNLISAYKANKSNTTYQIIDVSLNDRNLLGFITNSFKFCILNVTSGTIVTNFSGSYWVSLYQIQLTSNAVFILSSQKSISLFYFNSSTQINRYTINIPYLNPSKMAVCQSRTTSITYIAVWDAFSNLMVIENSGSSFAFNAQIPGNYSNPYNYITQINFDPQCKYMIVQKDQSDNIVIWDLLNKNIYKTIPSPSIIYQAQFYDPLLKYIFIGQANNATLLIYNTQTNTTIPFNYNQTFDIYSSYLMDGVKLVFVHTDSIVLYKNEWLPLNSFYQWYDCGTCLPTQHCSNLTGSCEVILVQNTSNTTTIISNNTNILNNTNSTDTNTQTIISPPSIQSQDQINPPAETISEYFTQFTKNSISYITLAIQLGPFAIFFISFINFWSICSFYALIQTEIPYYLNKMLNSIFDAENSSLLQMLNIQISADLGIKDKFQNSYLSQYGITSNFTQNHYEDFIKFGIACMVILFIDIINKIFKSINPRWSKIFKINSFFIVAVQFISFSFNFILPFKLIKNQGSFQNIKQKSNLAIYLLMIIIPIVCPTFFLIPQFVNFNKNRKQNQFQNDKKSIKNTKSMKSFNNKVIRRQYLKSNKRDEKQMTNSNHLQKTQKTINNKNLHKLTSISLLQIQQNRQIFSGIISPTLIILLIMFENIYLFMTLGLMVHIFNFIVSQMSISCKLNKIIMSSYLLFFHLNFIMIILVENFTDKDSNVLLKQILQVSACLIIFIGGIHEFLWLVYQIVFKMCRFLKTHCLNKINSKITDEAKVNSNQNNQKNNFVQTNVFNKFIKKSRRVLLEPILKNRKSFPIKQKSFPIKQNQKKQVSIQQKQPIFHKKVHNPHIYKLLKSKKYSTNNQNQNIILINLNKKNHTIQPQQFSQQQH